METEIFNKINDNKINDNITNDNKTNGNKKSKLKESLSTLLDDLLNSKNNNVRYINKTSFNNLGKFHKNMIYMFGRMLDLVQNGQIINYHEFVQVFEKLLSQKSDVEKQYIYGLFFPKTIKHATFLNP